MALFPSVDHPREGNAFAFPPEAVRTG